MRSLDPDCLRTFLTCVDATSFAEAGTQVNKSQSTVSMQVRRLEETIGHPLFLKRGRRNEITAAGRELRDYAERIVRLNDEAIARFDPRAYAARVRVGMPDDYAEAFLPDVIAKFARSNPHVELTIDCRTSNYLTSQINAGELDIAVVTRDRTTRNSEHLLTEPLAWFGPADRCLELERPVPLAIWHADCAWRALILEALEQAGISYCIAYTGFNGVALTAAVRGGLAVTALPTRFLGAGLRRIEPGPLPDVGDFEVGLLRGSTTNPAIDAFADEIVKAFATLARTSVAGIAA